MHRLALTCLALALVTGCGSKKPTTRATTAPPRPGESEFELIELRRDLEATVLENYLQLGLGNMEAYADSIARNRPVTLIGMGPDDVTSGGCDDARRTGVVNVGRACGYTRDRLPFRRRPLCMPESAVDAACQGVYSKTLSMQVSRDREVAWVFDELSYRLPHEGRQAAVPLRYSAVFVRDLERWVIVMEHVSYPLPDELVVALARDGELSPPVALDGPSDDRSFMPELRRYLAPDAAARAELARTRAELRASGATVDPQRVLALPDPRAEFYGVELFAPRTLSDRFGPETRLVERDELVFLSPSGRVAWVAATFEVRARREQQPVVIGMRLTAVFERDERDQWQLMQAHVSVPVRKEQLALRIFGDGLELPPGPRLDGAGPAAEDDSGDAAPRPGVVGARAGE